MVLAFAAAVARVGAECPAQFGDPLLLVGQRRRPGRSRRRGAAGAGGRFSRMALRTEEARSRRDLGTFALKDLGILIRVIGDNRALEVVRCRSGGAGCPGS